MNTIQTKRGVFFVNKGRRGWIMAVNQTVVDRNLQSETTLCL